jgi:hypothetical protein
MLKHSVLSSGSTVPSTGRPVRSDRFATACYSLVFVMGLETRRLSQSIHRNESIYFLKFGLVREQHGPLPSSAFAVILPHAQ